MTDINATATTSTGDGNIERLLTRVKEDRLACELLLALFMAACKNFKYHSLVRPCPPQYSEVSSSLHESNVSQKKQSELMALLLKLNNISSIVNIPNNSNLVSVLEWIMIPKKLRIQSLPLSQYSKILKEANPYGYLLPPPRALFEISHPDREDKESDYCVLGFHGSKLENFHSIIHNGLNPLFAKEKSLFGQGIYLATDLSVSMDYSPQGSFGWKRSLLGQRLSCIAVCYVDRNAFEESKKDSPQGYIVIQTNADIKLKYLLVYSQGGYSNRIKSVTNFFQKYKFAITIFIYITILLFVSWFKSS